MALSIPEDASSSAEAAPYSAGVASAPPPFPGAVVPTFGDGGVSCGYIAITAAVPAVLADAIAAAAMVAMRLRLRFGLPLIL